MSNLASNALKMSRSPLTMVSLCMLAVIGILLCLGVYELNITNELDHIINTDFNEAGKIIYAHAHESEFANHHEILAKYGSSLQSELNAHFKKRVESTYFNIAELLICFLFVSIAWLLLYKDHKHAKSVGGKAQKLEELLYYDQVREIHGRQHQGKVIPAALVNVQQNREEFITELQQALAREEFRLHYQPIVDAESGEVVAVEALLRWQHRLHGILMPDMFLSLCETTGLIVPIGAWVVRTACKQLKGWQDCGHAQLSIAVNISARQLNHPGFLPMINEVLKESQIVPACLKLEITESMLTQNTEAVIQVLQSLRHLGVQLSLDDFGTGYASLNYLKQFPFSTLKIDRSFVADITTNITSVAIVESIIALGKSLGLALVAEGVETENQLYLLKKMKCDMIQGYLYGKPIAKDPFTELLHKSNRASTQRNTISAAEQYEFKVMQREHFEQAVNVIAAAFCEHEPMTKYLGITHREFIPFAEIMVDKAIKDGLSIVAMDGDKMTACTIVEDVADPLNIAIDIDPRFKIIFSLLEHLGRDFFHEKDISQGHLAHLFITAVDHHYFGKGLSRKINFESIQLAKQKNFDFMCCEFTHHYNEKGTVKNLKNSKILIHSINYNEFIYEDKKPFATLHGSASAYIWELREGAKLRYEIKSQEIA